MALTTSYVSGRQVGNEIKAQLPSEDRGKLDVMTLHAVSVFPTWSLIYTYPHILATY